MAKETNIQTVAERYAWKHMEPIIGKAQADKPLKPDELKDLRGFLVAAGGLGESGIPPTVMINAIEASSPNTMTREIMRAEIELMKASLGYEGASMLEQLLIDQVCMCQHRMWIAEWRYNERRKMDDLTINQRLYDEKTLTMTQARYLKAIETLAKVRRLKLPAVQFNVAQSGAKQLNVAT